MMRDCTPTELMDRAAKLPQKARGSFHAWLVWLWDTGCVRVIAFFLTRQEAEKMNIITHRTLLQLLQGTWGFKVLIPF